MRCVPVAVLAACSVGSSTFDQVSVSVEFTDPSGVLSTDVLPLNVARVGGDGCEEATWYQFGGEYITARFGVPDSGGITFGPETNTASWWDGPDPLTADRSFLYGGVGTLLSDDSDQLQFQIESGEVRVWDFDADQDVASEQPGPVVIRLEGALGELRVDDGFKSDGSSTDSEGNAICGW